MHEISIIILVHNNQEYIDTILTYYSGTKINLIIADSSDNKLEHNYKNIQYKHFYNYTLSKKLFYALKIVKSQYVCLVGVDDFICIHAIINGILFLNKNSDYSSIIGRDLFYYLQSKEINFRPVYHSAHNSVISDNVIERIDFYFNNFRTFYSGIHRTQNLLEVFSLAQNKQSNLFLCEYLVCIFPLMQGKFKITNDLHTVRELNYTSNGFVSKNIDYVKENQFEEYENFIEIHNELFHIYNKNSTIDFKMYLKEVLDNYILTIKENVKKSQVIPFSKRIGNLLFRIPVFGKFIILKYRNYLEFKLMKNFYLSIEDKNELEKIKRILLNQKI